MTAEAPEAADEADLLDAVTRSFVDDRPKASTPLPVGVAVSGGGDSVALLHLMHRAAPQAGFRLSAVTVDHGLRSDAAAEAAQVAGLCAGLGIPHDTLRWQGPEATGNLMDQARRARIALIANWAQGRGIGHVVLGHTADDQAESFLMNLSRAAGLEGLSGMRGSWHEAGIHWARPLLGVGRGTLRDFLRRQGLSWIDDPTNEDDRFARVRARKALKALTPLGISVPGLVQSIGHLATANAALAQLTARAAEGITEAAGALTVAAGPFWAEPDEIRRRLLNGIIRWMGGAAYTPRAEQLARLEAALRGGRDATLGGLRFVVRAQEIHILREARAVTGAVPVGQIWDHRWEVRGPDGGEVRCLGAVGLAQVPDWREAGIPRNVAQVTPGVWRGDRLVSAPALGFGKGYSATIVPSLRIFLLSH